MSASDLPYELIDLIFSFGPSLGLHVSKKYNDVSLDADSFVTANHILLAHHRYETGFCRHKLTCTMVPKKSKAKKPTVQYYESSDDECDECEECEEYKQCQYHRKKLDKPMIKPEEIIMPEKATDSCGESVITFRYRTRSMIVKQVFEKNIILHWSPYYDACDLLRNLDLIDSRYIMALIEDGATNIDKLVPKSRIYSIFTDEYIYALLVNHEDIDTELTRFISPEQMSKAYIKFMSQVMYNMPEEYHGCDCLIVYMRDYNHLLFKYFTSDISTETVEYIISHSTMVDTIFNKKSLEPQDYLIKYFLDRMNKE